jgi:glycosyltransferase involved in cell wall biosynthesis
LLQWLCRTTARRADAVILVSEHMSAFLPPNTPFHVIPSGLDLDHFRPLPRLSARTQLGMSFEDRLVLFAGDPASPRKRYELAERAVALLDPALRARLVVAWGVPHSAMPSYMSACDALVFTSRQEGSPNVVKEALACDLPVVAVPVGDVATRVGHVDGCELCPDDQPRTIARALDRVLRRGTRCQGRAAVRELDERLTTARVIGIYRSLLRRPLRTAEGGLVADSGQP